MHNPGLRLNKFNSTIFRNIAVFASTPSKEIYNTTQYNATNNALCFVSSVDHISLMKIAEVQMCSVLWTLSDTLL